MCACVCIWLWAIHDHFYAAAVTMGVASVTMGGAYVTMAGEVAHSTLPHTRFFLMVVHEGQNLNSRAWGQGAGCSWFKYMYSTTVNHLCPNPCTRPP